MTRGVGGLLLCAPLLGCAGESGTDAFSEGAAESESESDTDPTVETSDAIRSGCTPSTPGGCTRHADCPSLICDTYAGGGRGRCIQEARALYVSASCRDPDLATGAKDDPFCRINQAVSAAAALAKDVIRVMPGFYLPFAVAGQKLSIFGPAGEDGIAQVFEEDAGAANVRDGADVLVDGFALGGPTHSAVRCTSARAVIRRSTLRSDVGDAAFITTACDVELDRAEIRTYLGAILFTDTLYRVTNTFITGSSERVAIRISGGQGSFRFVTVTGNYKETTPDGPFDCGAAPVSIQDSIVAGNRVYGDTGSQFRGACELQRVVVGQGDSSASAGAVHLDPMFEDGYRLPRNADNLACCIDRGPRMAGRLLRDIDGTQRPQGPRTDLGAFEAPL